MRYIRCFLLMGLLLGLHLRADCNAAEMSARDALAAAFDRLVLPSGTRVVAVNAVVVKGSSLHVGRRGNGQIDKIENSKSYWKITLAVSRTPSTGEYGTVFIIDAVTGMVLDL